MSDKQSPQSFPRREDERLVMFLQEHRPSPPLAPFDAEERLLQALDRLPTPNHPDRAIEPAVAEVIELPVRPRWQFWAIPGAIAASVLLAWGGYRVSAPQIAERRATELEEFLVRSWDGFVPAPADTLRTYEAEWLLLGAEPVPIESAASFGAQAEPASYP